MSCVYTAIGDYICNEHMTNVKPFISDYDKEFNFCKSFNPNNQISVLYNTNGNLPNSLKAFKSKPCDVRITKDKLNNDLKINKCYVVSANSTLAPNSDNVKNIMNSNNYKDESNNNLFKSMSLCDINKNYVVCDNKNIVDIALSKLQKKGYCYTGVTYDRNQKVG